MIVTLDSSAWIEYFAGSESGKIVKEYIDGSDTIYSSTIALFEIKHKYIREGKEWTERMDFIIERSVIVDVDTDLSLLAADLRHNLHLHSLDALIYATSKTTKSTLITKDPHFKDIQDVLMLQ